MRQASLYPDRRVPSVLACLASPPPALPRFLTCSNPPLCADVLNKLRQKHAAADGSGANFGIDVNTGGWAGAGMGGLAG